MCWLILAFSVHADVLGSALIQRSYPGTDYCTGCLFAYAAVPGADVGQTLSSWAFYAAANPSDPTNGNPTGAGNMITPLLFQSAGGDNLTVVGIGTTHARSGTPGVESYSFGLISGTATLAAGDYIGWRDGGTGAGQGNNGTISLDLGGGPGLYYSPSSLSYGGAVALGNTFAFTNNSTTARSYSVEFTTTPEPGFYGILALGLSGLVLAVTNRRRRDSAAGRD